ncbi:hypothetical protein G7070_04095 [Propioniciclava coleopterorum]|uniref:Lipoprotein n=1 Tax=Propioniciclava coleopterorum TaxID=2714937 RepID=A0A6G7Y3Y9_9ACTN|nr:hypothetical protein [Propioniciclava coleopterorum]QIK71604.1 hypothetical protein G7070_04095 [Propioniciclava coleopterorum]
MNKAIRPLAVAAIAALALTGCTSWPGSGGKVGTTRIPDEKVVRTAEVMTAATGAASTDALRSAAFDLTLGEASRQVVAANGIEFTPADKAAEVANSASAQAIIAAGGQEWADAVATTSLAIDRLGDERFLTGLRGLDIQINPRYGTWSPEQFRMLDSSLSKSIEALQINR